MSHRNEKDVKADIPDSIKSEVEFKFVKTIEEALDLIWGNEIWVGSGSLGMQNGRLEARL